MSEGGGRERKRSDRERKREREEGEKEKLRCCSIYLKQQVKIVHCEHVLAKTAFAFSPHPPPSRISFGFLNASHPFVEWVVG